MKYIVLKSTLAGVEQKIPIIFPNFMVHSHVAKFMAGLLIRCHGRSTDIKVVSAGDITMNVLACTGKSETCKVSADPGDQDLIQMYDYFQGIEPEPEIESKIRELLKEDQ